MPEPVDAHTPAAAEPHDRRLVTLARALGVLLIVGGTLVVYWPSRSGGFIMDDDLCLTNSTLIKAPDGLYRFWFTTEPMDYWPVFNTSMWLEWRLWEMNPTGYRATNVALHIASALLLWLILHRLGIPGAWLAALLFAVHPVNVESVAWISQRKNTLSMFFLLLSVLWYFNSEGTGREPGGDAAAGPAPPAGPTLRGGRTIWYLLSLAAFTFAMLSKGSVATLPLLLLLVVWWRRGRITRQDLARAAPLFVIAAILTAVNVWFQTHFTSEPIRDVTPLARLLGAGAAVCLYLYKALLPLNMAFVYPQWEIDPADWLWWAPLIAVVGLTAVLLWQRHSWWGRTLLFAWLFFCIALVPALGFADVGFMKYSLVANRYQHIAIIAVVTLLSAAGGTLYRRGARGLDAALLGAAAVVVAVLMLLTFEENKLYAEPIALYQDTLQKNPLSWLIHYNLGLELFRASRTDDAIAHYHEALRLKPDHLGARNNLGLALKQLGRLDEAIEQYQAVLKISPGYLKAHTNLGVALNQAGRREEAIEAYRETLRYVPDAAGIHSNLGIMLASSGRRNEAIKHFREAVRLSPNLPQGRYNLGMALKETRQLPEALEQFQELARQQPDLAEVYLYLAQILADMNRSNEAIAAAEQGLDVARRSDHAVATQRLQDWLTAYSKPSGSAAGPQSSKSDP